MMEETKFTGWFGPAKAEAIKVPKEISLLGHDEVWLRVQSQTALPAAIIKNRVTDTIPSLRDLGDPFRVLHAEAESINYPMETWYIWKVGE